LPSDPEPVRTDQHRVGVHDEEMPPADETVAAQLEQLLIEPSGPLPPLRPVADPAFRQRLDQPLVHEDAPFARADCADPRAVRRYDIDRADRMPDHAPDTVDRVRQRAGIFVDGRNEHVDRFA